jgi:putative hydroxymethylpyrimidine transport system ATP-binding protein
VSARGLRLRGALRLGDVVLMPGLDLHLPAGRWSVLLGASGAGKTSLARLVSGLDTPAQLDGGVRRSDGTPLPPGEVAMMAQADQLLPWAGAVDNVTIGARLRGAKADAARARALLSRLGLGGMEARRPAALSAGQRQRLALARLLYEARPVVVLDEPFSALDALTRLRMQDLAAAELRGRTVLLITHDPAEAMRLADAAWVVGPEGAAPVLLPQGPAPRSPEAAEVLEAQAALLARLRGVAPLRRSA